MSNIGKQPSVASLNLEPLSVDPANPREGDIFYSDGTPRTEGPWVYQNGAWAQFSTGSAIKVLTDLTLIPQSADPSILVTTGMIFYADGTSRAEGMWVYNSSGDWVQISGIKFQVFTQKTRFYVRAASTISYPSLADLSLRNGGSFGGLTINTNDLILIKDQVDTTQNGVYVVQTGANPIRSTSYDTAAELTAAQVQCVGGTNVNNIYFQHNTITNIATDAQSWTTSPYVQTFTVPAGVNQLKVLACGGGGSGQTGNFGNDGTNTSSGGGGGGSGAALQEVIVPVNPGNVLSITVGPGGRRATVGSGGGANGIATTISGISGSNIVNTNLYFPAGKLGNAASGITGGSAQLDYAAVVRDASSAFGGGAGGNAGSGASGGELDYTSLLGGTIAGQFGGVTPGGGLSSGGGGGGGSSNFGQGGLGGSGATNGNPGLIGGDAPATNYGAGGGGGGGGTEAGSQAPGAGGAGADGYVRISW